jgi:hypothetical protein
LFPGTKVLRRLIFIGAMKGSLPGVLSDPEPLAVQRDYN